MNVLRIFLILGMIGHAINFWCDRVLAITPNGRLALDTMNDVNDESKMAYLFKDVDPNLPFQSAMLGTLALVLQFFGYFSIAYTIWTYSALPGFIMFIGLVIFVILGSGHHVKYALGVWMFIKGGLDQKSYAMLKDLYNNFPITKLAYAGYILYVITLIVTIVAGVGHLAFWNVIFTILPIFIVLAPFKIIGTLHISAIITFMGWLLII